MNWDAFRLINCLDHVVHDAGVAAHSVELSAPAVKAPETGCSSSYPGMFASCVAAANDTHKCWF